MSPHEIENASTTEGLPVSPSLQPTLDAADVPMQLALVDQRVVMICLLCVLLAVAAALIARGLVHLIALITNLSFYGHLSLVEISPWQHRLGAWVIGVPALGGLIVGLMARYGSKAIRGHGIPEAMEQVLTRQSRIPPRITFLKPLSSAVAIGTGGPFGAEGPIIATGGALGSLIGQVLRTTAAERKTLLAAGAAAGMAAIFGSPVSATLLAIELLLFEFRPRSLIPVALAAATAAGMRIAFVGSAPVFPMPDLATPTGLAIASYILIGAIVGIASVTVTRLVYAVEEGFERLPIHWAWWPAIGGLVVGVVGYFAPRTLGVGYENISELISGHLALRAAIFLCLMKLLAWSVALGSGTSGGTLAPLFTIGSGLGLVLGAAAAWAIPVAAIDPRIAALVGMAAIFAGASRAPLTSAVFAFETTLQPLGLLPLIGGCTAAYLISCLLMKHSIMTEKIARRGIRVPVEYAPDYLSQIAAGDAASRNPVTLKSDDPLSTVRNWLSTGAPGTSHQGFPVVNLEGHLIGVLTRRDLLNPDHAGTRPVGGLIHRPPKFVYTDTTLRQAADHMVNHDIGRLPVLSREDNRLVGILTRSDLLSAHRQRLREASQAESSLSFRDLFKLRRAAATAPSADTSAGARSSA